MADVRVAPAKNLAGRLNHGYISQPIRHGGCSVESYVLQHEDFY
jgi:hypothetical protein